MNSLPSHLKDNKVLYNALSSIDKKVYTEYNVPYCTYESNTIFFIIIGDSEKTRHDWNLAKEHCIDKGVVLEFSIVTEDEYISWVRDFFPEHKLLESGFFSLNENQPKLLEY